MVQTNIKVSYKLILSYFKGGVTSHAENIQNKYAISLQHHKKEMSDEVNFLHADKHRSFLQTNTIFLGGLPGYAQSTQASLQYFCDISR